MIGSLLKMGLTVKSILLFKNPFSIASAGLFIEINKLHKAMTNLKIVYTETHQVKKIYVEEIDLRSSTQWTSLIDKVRSRIDDDSYIKDLPTEPSDNLDDWLSLFYFLNADEYSQKVEAEVKIENPLICERVWSIQNQAGEILIQDCY